MRWSPHGVARHPHLRSKSVRHTPQQNREVATLPIGDGRQINDEVVKVGVGRLIFLCLQKKIGAGRMLFDRNKLYAFSWWLYMRQVIAASLLSGVPSDASAPRETMQSKAEMLAVRNAVPHAQQDALCAMTVALRYRPALIGSFSVDRRSSRLTAEDMTREVFLRLLQRSRSAEIVRVERYIFQVASSVLVDARAVQRHAEAPIICVSRKQRTPRRRASAQTVWSRRQRLRVFWPDIVVTCLQAGEQSARQFQHVLKSTRTLIPNSSTV